MECYEKARVAKEKYKFLLKETYTTFKVTKAIVLFLHPQSTTQSYLNTEPQAEVYV